MKVILKHNENILLSYTHLLCYSILELELLCDKMLYMQY